MRVLHIIPSLGNGGAEKLLLSLLEYSTTSMTCGLCCLYGRQNTFLEDSLNNLNIQTWYLDKRSGPDLRMFGRIKKVIYEFHPDVVHTHRYAINYSVLPQILMKVSASIHTIHNEPRQDPNRFGTIIQKYAFSHHLVQPVALSPGLSKEAENYYALSNVPYVLNGIDTRAFGSVPGTKVELRMDLGLPSEGQAILHVGRFSPPKNHAVLIKSFHLLRQSYADVQLWLVGEGSLQKSCEQLVKELALTDSVHFLGIRRDIPRIMAAADIFVLSSDSEGIPLVVMEAMASGLPVVATSVGGLPELVKTGETGLLVPVGDHEKMARAVHRILTDNDQKIAMGRAALELARSNYDKAVMARRYHQLYIDLLQDKARRVENTQLPPAG